MPVKATFPERCVFIVGCPRSGTTLLNSMLMSDPAFAVYEAETLLLDVCGPRYGPLHRERNYRRFLDDWFRSKQFQRSGLSREEFLQAVEPWRDDLAAVLGAFMQGVSRKQGVERWAESTPSNVFHLVRIAETFPAARIVHVIRDPRAVALSLSRLGWTGASEAGGQRMPLLRASAKWRLSVSAASKARSALAERYLELRYEDLVEHTDATVQLLNDFLDSKVSMETMSARRVGSLARNNSAFGDGGENSAWGLNRSALGRWREQLTADQCALVEAVAGGLLQEHGYQASQPAEDLRLSEKLVRHRMSLTSSLRRRTPLGRFSRTALEITE